ncbi:disease resistance protein RUN1-like [Ziziphus jujuba]|uniref:Disease resistance protein RUN1-like n=1 Tax=Ziziphus jujuba TaxID=326968 RepID=A0ABM3ZUJ7_ZIZJJ|nr:disease resistance protein RUN1-like [Ziziphus jujuba]
MGTPFVGSNFVEKQLPRKSVLVVLDDVNNSKQLEYLAGEHVWFGHGSINEVEIYEVEKLDCDEPLELFHLNALRNNSLETDYADMLDQAVAYANGIPLALKVLGSFLCSKSKEEWESALFKLIVVPKMEIQNVLRLSYEGLDDREKEIFLDIACFFNGDDRDDVQSILNACGFFADIGIRVLIDKSLITIMDNKLWMHGLLQEMGKEIIYQQSIKEPGNHGTTTAEGISLDMSKLDTDVYSSPAAFLKMKSLRLLKIYSSFSMDKRKIHFPQGFQFLPGALRYLHWDGYPLKALPLSFIAMNLIELRMHNSQNLDSLKKIDLSYFKHLTQIPDLFRAPTPEKLPGSIKYIDFCKTTVKKFPSSMWSLNQLETLMFENCKSLTDLPSSACNLKSLKRFSLYYCTSLLKFQDLPRNITWLTLAGTAIEMVPSSIGCLSHLFTLDMTFCEMLECLPTTLYETAIEDIPSSIANLSRLGILMLDGCECLEVLPNNIYNIKGLKLSLSGLSGCSSFDKFPPLSGTCYLGELDLSHLNRLQVPIGVSSLSSLQILNLSRSKIESLPTSMKYLSTLAHLDLRKCKNLKSLPELPPFLELLQVDDYASLETDNFKE